MRYVAFAAVLLSSAAASAQDAPCPPAAPEGGVCLSAEDRKVVVDSLKELKDIKGSKAELEFKDEIVIVRDWEDRVYVNGGEKKPLRLHLKVGTVDRDLEATLPVRVAYREKPPDPMFRLRFRAEGGVLVPAVFKVPKSGFDAGVGFDFFHLGPVNLSLHAGFRAGGGILGVDLTKNFGPFLGYAVAYDGWKSNAVAGVYFSLN